MIHRYTLNERGKDYAVGDVHGHFTKLQQQLDAIGFNQDVDRLFSVGDLVDRGPECDRVLDWLAKPWFHPVRGNHESAHEAGLTKDEREVLLWDRRRITEMDATPVAGLRALIVGHTPLMQHTVLGNVHYIDSGAWHYTERPYLILRLDTLEAV